MKLLILIAFTLFISVVTQNLKTQRAHITKTILSNYLNGSTKMAFKVWHFLFSKNYDINTEEGLKKYKIFKNRVQKIKEHNAKNLGYTLGLNHMSDKSYEELNDQFNIKPVNLSQMRSDLQKAIGDKVKFTFDDYVDEDEMNEQNEKLLKEEKERKDDENVSYPEMEPVTWVDYFPAVRNQKRCGSCWAFATLGLVEAEYWIKHKNDANAKNEWLSTQQMVDCAKGCDGCKGGYYINAVRYIVESGLTTDSTYPYEAKDNTCRYKPEMKKKEVVVKELQYGGNEKYFQDAIRKGPVGVAVGVTDAWYDYEKGFFESVNCQTTANHAVIVAGVGCDPTRRSGPKCYFIIRNSWGETWGEAGYMKMNYRFYTCGITTSPNRVIVE